VILSVEFSVLGPGEEAGLAMRMVNDEGKWNKGSNPGMIP
jgi:hypothetical protein